MRFKIGEKTYETTSTDQVSLRDLVLFNTQAAELGIPERWGDVEAAMREMDDLDKVQANRHPAKFLVMAVTVWAARRAVGEDLTFSEAIDVPVSQINIVPDPQDHKPGKAKGGQKPRKGSARAAAPVAPESDETTAPQTESGSASTPE
jgi:hypothetical protein